MRMNRLEYSLMTFDPGRQVYLRGIVRKLRRISQLLAGKKILEIGCGNGVGSKFIMEIFKPKEFIATELDERLVDIARMKNKGAKILFEVGNAVNLRFPDNEFDAVIGLSVIHHIPNWRDCIDEVHRIIKPGGLLIIKELSIETFETPFGRLSRRIVSHPYDSMFRENEFLETIKEKGFEICAHQPHSIPIFMDDFFLVGKKESG
jgi:ubiquinone/menaquinone biosynthesis C-methylase UbiE